MRNYAHLNDRGSTINDYLPIFRSGTEGSDSLEEVIVSDKNVKVILQLPTNNRKENIKVIVHNDNSLRVTCWNPKGEPSHYSMLIPYEIDVNSARRIYRNGILEVSFNRM